ncbi:hypothetical protein bAD24_p00890 (plasmid) [Burkholderia sp. AD24]|nr:hypothetical protein bAD24_p00890 [Burkholderia sp. AD24]
METKSVEDAYRDYVARLGDKDLWLKRADAAVLCRVISLSLPAISWRGIQARICAVLSRETRMSDRWMLGLQPGGDVDLLPVSIPSLGYLLTHGSSTLRGAIRDASDASGQIRKMHGVESADMVVGDLYAVLAAGHTADGIRAKVKREAAMRACEANEREKKDAIVQAQRQWLSEHDQISE